MHTDENKPYEFAVNHSEEQGKKIRKKIWFFFWVLLIITSVEVGLGIKWKDWGLNWDVIKMTFLVLTILKAFFIVSEYMHLKHERKWLKNLIVVPFVMFVLYLVYHLITEGTYSAASLHFFW